MTVQDTLSKLFETWIATHRSIHEIVLCDNQGLPIASSGINATANEIPISAATSAAYSTGNNLKTLFAENSLNYVSFKIKKKKILIFKIPNQDMLIVFLVSNPSADLLCNMTKIVDLIFKTC